MRSTIITLAACFLVVGLLAGCSCLGGASPMPELTLRSPILPGWTAPGTPVRAVPAWQGATFSAPQYAPQYTAPAAPGCP